MIQQRSQLLNKGLVSQADGFIQTQKAPQGLARAFEGLLY
ncbi:hypothetical protein CECT5772_06048 [Streptococcus equi subsp. ruminatorum CECT 5772]|uniref:Uncharacterized protein n=1 Tax=Streptococcus equi subsp. ruminatorum CECT 5772 TaxID=1051981 RepID=A0A922NU01_9STRE|nr:hypothetical protein CECT5772_06048 [Streptococcus equi subsp. ruminatorum CECT 5772]